MRNVHTISSGVVMGSFLIIAFIAFFDGSEFFVNLAQVMSVPALLFSFANLWMSIADEMILRYEFLSEMYNRLHSRTKELVFQTTQRLELFREQYQDSEGEGIGSQLRKYENDSKTYEAICQIIDKLKCRRFLLPNFAYFISLLSVVLGGFLSQWLFESIPQIANMQLPTIALLTLAISMFGVQFKSHFAKWSSDRQINKLIEKVDETRENDEENKNGI